MSLNRLEKNLAYASRTGMPRAYLWGAEWWYWMDQKKGQSIFVDRILKLKKE